MAKNLSRRTLLKGAVALGTAIPAAVVSGHRPSLAQAPAPASLPYKAHVPGVSNDAAQPPLRYWATRGGIEVGGDLGQTTILGVGEAKAREYNLGEIAWTLRWDILEPIRGNLKFDLAQNDLKYATRNQIAPVGHSIIWYASNPSWLNNGGFSQTVLGGLLRDHVFDTVSYFRGSINRWAVVNEFGNGPDTVSQNLFYKILGLDTIDIAYQAARDANPYAKLLYNDLHNESLSAPRYTRVPQTKAIVDRLKSQGLIDGVGLQMHIDGSKPPTYDDLITTMRAYGVPVYITEMDVNLKDVTGTTDQRFSIQADVYRTTVQAALDSGVCKSIAFFNLGDKNSWIELDSTYSQYSPIGDPTMFDDDLTPKPAYYAVLEVLRTYAQKVNPGG